MIDVIYDILFHPAAGLRRFRWDGRQKLGWFLLAAAMWLPWMVEGLWLQESLGRHAGAPAIVMIIAGITMTGLWVGNVTVMHFAAGLAGGVGRPAMFVALLGAAMLPRLLLLPVWAAAAWTNGNGSWFLCGLAEAALGIWTLVLTIWAIRVHYGFSLGKAVLVWLAPVIVILVPLIVAVMAGIIFWH